MSFVSSPADSQQPLTRGARIFGRLTLLVLAIYWLGMFTGTHWPRLSLPGFSYSDKLVHSGAFFGLAILVCTFWAARSGSNRVNLFVVFAGLAFYALLDEVSQIPVGRDCDPLDWLADMAGTLLGIAIFALATWKSRRATCDDTLVVPRRIS